MIDTGALLQVVWASFAAGVGLVTAASVAIAGAARAGKARRAGHRAVAVANLVLAVVAGLVCAAAVALGVGVMLGA